jgi:hypothetical protein
LFLLLFVHVFRLKDLVEVDILLVFAVARPALHQVEEHVGDLLGEEGNRPAEHVHVVWETVGRLGLLILLETQVAAVDDQDRGLVLIVTAVIRGRENGYYIGKRLGSVPPVHLVALDLNLVATYNSHQIVVVKEFLGRLLSEEVGALTLFVLDVLPIVGDLVC